jgi:hypothetical protein
VLRGTVDAVEAELALMAESKHPDSHTMHVLRSLRRQLEASLQALQPGGEVSETGPEPTTGPDGRRRR